MKSIIFVRHAKSSWSSLSLSDFDRPLNDRGQKDAPAMAKKLLEKNVAIDAFVTSTALRAVTTARHFAQVFKAGQEQLIELPELYHAYPPAFYAAIKKLDDSLDNVAIFAHNPGITDMVNHMNVAHLDEMPTCAVFGVLIHAESWKDFAAAEKKFWFFDYPKH